MKPFHNPPFQRLVPQKPLKIRYINSMNMYLYRTRMHLTQTELARLVESDRKTIYNIERAKVVPSVIMAIKIAKVLGQPVEEIFKISQHSSSAIRFT